jgi:glutamate--cysteine ligase
VLANEAAKINDASLTPSAQILSAVVNDNQSLTQMALKKATDYRQQLLGNDYQAFNEEYFIKSVADSLNKQAEIEQSDNVDFDTFLQNYFS